MKDRFFDDFFDIVNEKQIIDDEVINLINQYFSNRAESVLITLKRGLTKYLEKSSNRVIWGVNGEKKEHFLYPKLFCNCKDFYKVVVIERKRNLCKHLIAQVISSALTSYKEVRLEKREFQEKLGTLQSKF